MAFALPDEAIGGNGDLVNRTLPFADEPGAGLDPVRPRRRLDALRHDLPDKRLQMLLGFWIEAAKGGLFDRMG